MFSERGNDGIERSGEQWFKRHNAKAPEKGGARKVTGGQGRGLAGEDPQGVGADGEPGARAGGPEAERIDGRSLADLRDEAHRAGDLKRSAELSREPNVHLGPERYRTSRGGASETVQAGGARRAEERGGPERAGRRPQAGGAAEAGDRRGRGAAEGDL